MYLKTSLAEQYYKREAKFSLRSLKNGESPMPGDEPIISGIGLKEQYENGKKEIRQIEEKLRNLSSCPLKNDLHKKLANLIREVGSWGIIIRQSDQMQF